MIRFMATALLLGAGFLHGAHGMSAAAEARIRIVFFTPSDVEPPPGVRQWMKEIVDYGQAFYGRWLEHWGYEPENILPIDRDENGMPIVYFVKGKETAASGKYDNVGIQGAIREQAIAEHSIQRKGSTWWMFVYGTRLRASRGWGGWGDDRGNGLTLLVWHEAEGELTRETPLAGGLADEINLKGYLHELGHTMSLPNGVLKVVFCFDNGVFTGTGQGPGFPHAAEIPYEFKGGAFRIPAKR